MNELAEQRLRRRIEKCEADLRDDLHDSLSHLRFEMRLLVETRVGEIERRLETVHREALKVLTDHYTKGTL